MDISRLREEYRKASLDEGDLRPDPLEQFRFWFDQALSAKLREPNAMVLATVDEHGQPWTRAVLLKRLDDRGLVFFSNFESRKARHMAANPRVSVLFLWLELERQVSINGTVQRVPTAESLAYFVTRPLGSRLGAWTSRQSAVITSRSLLEAKLAEMKRKFADGKVPPSFWGGYRITPESYEFWQGRPDRLHDRFLYSKTKDGWRIERLQP